MQGKSRRSRGEKEGESWLELLITWTMVYRLLHTDGLGNCGFFAIFQGVLIRRGMDADTVQAVLSLGGATPEHQEAMKEFILLCRQRLVDYRRETRRSFYPTAGFARTEEEIEDLAVSGGAICSDPEWDFVMLHARGQIDDEAVMILGKMLGLLDFAVLEESDDGVDFIDRDANRVPLDGKPMEFAVVHRAGHFQGCVPKVRSTLNALLNALLAPMVKFGMLEFVLSSTIIFIVYNLSQKTFTRLRFLALIPFLVVSALQQSTTAPTADHGGLGDMGEVVSFLKGLLDEGFQALVERDSVCGITEGAEADVETDTETDTDTPSERTETDSEADVETTMECAETDSEGGETDSDGAEMPVDALVGGAKADDEVLVDVGGACSGDAVDDKVVVLFYVDCGYRLPAVGAEYNEDAHSH